MNYFKVVKVHTDDKGEAFRTSFLAKQDAEVQYGTEIVSVAPEWLADLGYHLTVFSDMRNVIGFLDRFREYDLSNAEIWVAEITDPITAIPPAVPVSRVSYGVDSLRDEIRLSHSPKMQWPIGTLMAKEVKLKTKLQMEVIMKDQVYVHMKVWFDDVYYRFLTIRDYFNVSK